jgi:acyl-CoA thioesterase-2
MDAHDLFTLVDHGPDTFVGRGPAYPWGGLYGGQIVAQALHAATNTVPEELGVHSLRAYFIRRGDPLEPIRYEVDRIRNGRSFCTRRVVARQAIGAILNLEASFQAAEPSEDVQTIASPLAGLPTPDEVAPDSWSTLFERRMLSPDLVHAAPGGGAGRMAAWMRMSADFGADSLLHECSLAFLSDDLPTDSVTRAIPTRGESYEQRRSRLFVASLDHTIWFHRPMRADRWHLHDFVCHTFVGGRGLAIGHIFDEGGTHVATVAQEQLIRDTRSRG